MEIFERRYFNLNKKFLMIIGFWPYETCRMKFARRSFFMIAILVQSTPLLTSAIVHQDNTNRLMINILGLLIGLSLSLKMLALLVGEKKMKVLLESIADNWSVIQDENEREILYKYSERGRKLTIYYAVLYLTAIVIMSLSPLIPKILDLINPLIEPRQNLNLLQGEHFIDKDKYFSVICFSDALSCLIAITIVISIDSMYITASQHCCALNAIIRYRLLNLKPMGVDQSSTTKTDNSDSHDWVVQLIEFHKKALEFTKTLNNSFCLTFLFLLTIYFFMLPLLACSILANYHHPLAVYPYVIFFVGLSLNLFALCWPGQIISDHGSNLYEAAYNNEWYETPVRTRKLLLIFMLRCSRPTILTAGWIMVINFQTFSTIMRTAVSFITTLASFI